MTQQAIEARKAYKRKWAQNNPEKIRQYQKSYWEKRAAEEAAGAAATASEPSDKEGR